MAVNLENQQYIIELVPCLCQINKNAKFSQCAIGITKQEIMIFSDMEPNFIVGEVFYYKPFAKIPNKTVVTLVRSEIRKNEELKKYTRLDIFTRDLNECRILYFPNKEKPKLARFLKAAKQVKIKITKNVVNYKLGSC